MSFPSAIAESYRVVETKYGQGDGEETIPLGSWRKGQGLEGKRGHVYRYGNGWSGVWLKARQWVPKVAGLSARFPNLRVMQAGDGEVTFRVPDSDLDAILPMLGAKKRFKASSWQLAAAEKGRLASPLRRQRPVPTLGRDE